MNSNILKEFHSPSSEFRGKPFWAWNGLLEEGELRRQIRIMEKMGLGGFFMHSRVGLKTPYLSDEWFRLVNACIDEAEKCGMEAWLYDEDRWPSGAAGGLVTRNPRYRMRKLEMKVLENAKEVQANKDTLAIFTACVKDGKAINIKHIPIQKHIAVGKNEKILVFRIKIQSCSNWYNGFTYLDTMNYKAVQKFIDVTHKAYSRHFKNKFGKIVPGIFTDEPNYGRVFEDFAKNGNIYSIPWTDALPSIFRTRYGYDILEYLPELFFNAGEQKLSRPRWHYYDCITHLFVDAFARQIGEWCDKNGLLHTGHVLDEETLISQTRVVGSCMRFYEYMQAPGIDVLSEYRTIYDTAKQASSAARQFGRRWRLTETYGCTGWDFTFAGHKAVGDWQAALGINLRCHHLVWYTMEGQAKRDYPASMHHHSPWWESYPAVEDYFSRINVLMSGGSEIRDLLVIHPVESVWASYNINSPNDASLWKYCEEFQDIGAMLLANHIDYDFGDEDILARHGKVSGKNETALLKINKADYRAVLVPPLLTMRRTTLELLKEFNSKGGTVVFTGKIPEFLDALPSDDLLSFAKTCACPKNKRELLKTIGRECRRISIKCPDGRETERVLYQLCEDEKYFRLFICNTGLGASQIKKLIPVSKRRACYPDILITDFPECSGQPEEWDPSDGKRYSANAHKTADGHWIIRTSLPSLGSRLFIIPKRKTGNTLSPRPEWKIIRSIPVKKLKWDYHLNDYNVLVLDKAQYCTENGEWQPEKEILKIDMDIRDALRLPHRGDKMVQPWARKDSGRKHVLKLELLYRFSVAAVPKKSVFLALEHPERMDIRVNNNYVYPDLDCGWWVDHSLRKILVDSPFLKSGENEIRITTDYKEDDGLETMYLLGNFGVRLHHGINAEIRLLPSKLRVGDWCRQGLPFYSGNVSYRTKIKPVLKRGERLWVKIPEFRGVGVRIFVDGTPACVMGWEPYEKDITDYISRPSAELTIQVLGHRRNSHGPLHNTEKHPMWLSPHHFISGGEWWQDSYNLVPCGLMKNPEFLVKRQR